MVKATLNTRSRFPRCGIVSKADTEGKSLVEQRSLQTSVARLLRFRITLDTIRASVISGQE